MCTIKYEDGYWWVCVNGMPYMGYDTEEYAQCMVDYCNSQTG